MECIVLQGTDQWPHNNTTLFSTFVDFLNKYRLTTDGVEWGLGISMWNIRYKIIFVKCVINNMVAISKKDVRIHVYDVAFILVCDMFT